MSLFKAKNSDKKISHEIDTKMRADTPNLKLPQFPYGVQENSFKATMWLGKIDQKPNSLPDHAMPDALRKTEQRNGCGTCAIL